MTKLTPKEVIDRIASSQEIIEFATIPGRAFVLVGQLQLALRHPENYGPSADVAREMIAHMAQAIATTTDTPEVLEMIAMGGHPEFDLTHEEANEIFGERPTPEPERRLTLSLDLAEDYDAETIGLALVMLMRETPDPEATYQQLREALTTAKIEPVFSLEDEALEEIDILFPPQDQL